MKGAEAFVKLSLKDGALRRGLNRSEARFKAFGAGVSAIGKKLLVFGLVGAAGFGHAIKAASRMEETMNKFNVVFGKNSKVVKQWADDYAEDVGRSEQQIADFMAGSQDLFVPLGFDSASAEKMSKQVTSLAVDLASFNNKADADTLNDLHAALTGSGEVMKKYGVIVNETAVKQELLNQGLNAKNATEQQKAQARLAIIMRGTTAAQGDAIRSSGSWANQLKRLRAEVDNTAVSIGKDLLPIVTPLLGKIAEAVKTFGKWAKENKAFVIMAMKVTAGIIALGAAMVILGPVISGIGSTFGLLSKAVGLFGTVFSAVISLPGLMTIAFAAVITSALGLMGVFDNLFVHFSAAWDGIKNAIMSGNITGAFKILSAAIKVTWHQLVFNLMNIFDKFVTGIAIAVTPVRKVFFSIAEAFSAAFLVIKEKFHKLMVWQKYAWLKAKMWMSIKIRGGSDAEYNSSVRDLNEIEQNKYAKIDAKMKGEYTESAKHYQGKRNESDSEYKARLGRESADRMKGHADAVKKAQDELKNAITAVKENTKKANSPKVKKAKDAVTASQKKLKAMAKGTAVGSFRAADLRHMNGGTNSAAERNAKAAEQTSKNTKKTNELLKKKTTIGLNFS